MFGGVLDAFASSLFRFGSSLCLVSWSFFLSGRYCKIWKSYFPPWEERARTDTRACVHVVVEKHLAVDALSVPSVEGMCVRAIALQLTNLTYVQMVLTIIILCAEDVSLTAAIMCLHAMENHTGLHRPCRS